MAQNAAKNASREANARAMVRGDKSVPRIWSQWPNKGPLCKTRPSREQLKAELLRRIPGTKCSSWCGQQLMDRLFQSTAAAQDDFDDEDEVSYPIHPPAHLSARVVFVALCSFCFRAFFSRSPLLSLLSACLSSVACIPCTRSRRAGSGRRRRRRRRCRRAATGTCPLTAPASSCA
jgi:hypothetical protein